MMDGSAHPSRPLRRRPIDPPCRLRVFFFWLLVFFRFFLVPYHRLWNVQRKIKILLFPLLSLSLFLSFSLVLFPLSFFSHRVCWE